MTPDVIRRCLDDRFQRSEADATVDKRNIKGLRCAAKVKFAAATEQTAESYRRDTELTVINSAGKLHPLLSNADIDKIRGPKR